MMDDKPRHKKFLKILIEKQIFKVSISSGVKYKNFLSQYLEGKFDTDLKVVFEDEGVAVFNPYKIRSFWFDDHDVKERKGSTGFYRINVFLKSNTCIDFLCTGSNRSRSHLRTISNLVGSTPDERVYILNQEEDVAALVFKHDEEIIGVSLSPVKINNDNDKKDIKPNKYTVYC